MGTQTLLSGSWYHLTVSSCGWHFHFLPSPCSSRAVCILFPVHRGNAEWQSTRASSITHFRCYLPVKLHSGFLRSRATKGALGFNCALALSRAVCGMGWNFHETLLLQKKKKKEKLSWNEKKVFHLWAAHASPDFFFFFFNQGASFPGNDVPTALRKESLAVVGSNIASPPPRSDELSCNWWIKILPS